MPFTASHPALIVPLTWWRNPYVSASCLIIGSITPDFEYFLTMKASGRFSHTLPGVFYFDLPLALVLVFLFHGLVKQSLIDNLPVYVAGRWQILARFSFVQAFRKYWPGYVLCLLAGIFSHLLWDSCTDATGFFIRNFSSLPDHVSLFGWRGFPLHRYLHYGSSLLGILVLMISFHRLPFSSPYPIKLSVRYWLGIVSIAIVAFLIRWSFSFEYFADVVATLFACMLLGLIIVSFIYSLLHSTRQPIS
jgi:hypothetical protein